MSPILDRLLVLVQRCRRIEPAGYEVTLRVVPSEMALDLAGDSRDATDAPTTRYANSDSARTAGEET